jgi:hypothetical protein
MESKATEQPRREWNPRHAFIPNERRVDERHTAFRTHDQSIYVRHVESGVIRRAQPKTKGKAARRAEKLARRSVKPVPVSA